MRRQPCGAVLFQDEFTDFSPWRSDHERGDDLAPFGMGKPDNTHLGDTRMLAQNIFNLIRLHRFTATADHLLDPPGDGKRPIVVQTAEIAGAEPPILKDLRCQVSTLPVAFHDMRAADEDFSRLSRRNRPVKANDHDITAKHRPPNRFYARAPDLGRRIKRGWWLIAAP